MAQDRFDKLEGDKALPGEVKDALAHLSRFHALEIGASRPAPAPKAPERRVCLHCQQPNEPERQTCWACFKSLEAPKAKAKPKPAGPEDITLVLDGVTYTSADPALPGDIKVLMDRIRAEGYSQALMSEWQNWRLTRNTQKLRGSEAADIIDGARAELDERDIKVFKGQRVSVIRIDGKVYTSDDPKLTPELRQLFEYIEKNGVTPALMEYLRGFGDSVKFRPPDTVYPSDGDLAFWEQVNQGRPSQLPARGPAGAAAPPGGGVERELARREAEDERERAQRRYDAARGRLMVQLGGVALFILYIVLSVILR